LNQSTQKEALKKNLMNANASTFVPSTFLSKEDKEGEEEDDDDKYFAIDVECVATGYTHNDRAVAQIAVVDDAMRTLVNVFVNSNTTNIQRRGKEETSTASTSYDDENENDTNIVSTIEPLTGITREKLEKEGIPFEDGKKTRTTIEYLTLYDLMVFAQ